MKCAPVKNMTAVKLTCSFASRVVKTMLEATPRKSSKKLIPKPPKVSDFCRLCKVKFKKDDSTENLFKPSKRKQCFVLILAEVCARVGIEVENSAKVSDSVCRPCGRKIRNAVTNYSFVKVHISLQRIHFYTKLGSNLSNLCPKESLSEAFLYFFHAFEIGNIKFRPRNVGDWDL